MALYLNDEQSNVVRVRMGAAVSLEGVRAVAVAPALAVGFEALTMEARFFQQVGDRIGASIALDGGGDGTAETLQPLQKTSTDAAPRAVSPRRRSSSGEPPSPGKAWAGSASVAAARV